MGLRSRLRESVQGLLGRTPVTAPTPVSPKPGPSPAPVRPKPVAAATPAAPAPVAATPVAATPVAPAPAPVAAPIPAVALASLLQTDDHADAPVRNAHYAAVRETTDAAFRVRVYNSAEGLDVTFSVEPGEYVLDAAERAGFLLPFSCRAGGCLTCSAKTEGEVRFEMGEQYVLDEDVVGAGYCLLCCTSVSTDAVFLSHQQDNIG